MSLSSESALQSSLETESEVEDDAAEPLQREPHAAGSGVEAFKARLQQNQQLHAKQSEQGLQRRGAHGAQGQNVLTPLPEQGEGEGSREQHVAGRQDAGRRAGKGQGGGLADERLTKPEDLMPAQSDDPMPAQQSEGRGEEAQRGERGETTGRVVGNAVLGQTPGEDHIPKRDSLGGSIEWKECSRELASRPGADPTSAEQQDTQCDVASRPGLQGPDDSSKQVDDRAGQNGREGPAFHGAAGPGLARTQSGPEKFQSAAHHRSPKRNVSVSPRRPLLFSPRQLVLGHGRQKHANGYSQGLEAEDPAAKLLVNDKKKYLSFATRLWSTIWMVSGFILIVYMGHVYIWALIVALQIMMAHELFVLAENTLRARHQEAFHRFLNWHFFVTAMVYVYGNFMQRQLMLSFTSPEVPSPNFKGYVKRIFLDFIRYHPIISYALYLAGFVWFILSLKSKQYKYQFGQFAWTHMILFLIFCQSSFFVANIFQGIIWFLLPCSLIIVNDCSAYFFGFFFGRTPLIKLSPKKTWEGFLGASVTTIAFAFVLAGIMGRFQWLTCPRKDLGVGPLQCQPDYMFQPQPHAAPPWLRPVLPVPWQVWWIRPVQLHALVFGAFASSIAPFGGFFASGFKRAFKIKDFGDTIPGHGGITDRMDCQMLMAVFSYIYYQSFIAPHTITVENMLSQMMNMELEQLKEVYVRMGNYLVSQGLNLTELHGSEAPQLAQW